MEPQNQYALIGGSSLLIGLFVGYRLGRHKWENKKSMSALNHIITMGGIFGDTLEWVLTEGVNLDQEEFINKLQEKMAYAGIVSNELT